jgi:TatD DNase family protein
MMPSRRSRGGHQPGAVGGPHACAVSWLRKIRSRPIARELSGLWPDLRFGIGLHPHQAGQFASREDELEPLVRRAIAGQPGARGLGEIGLDYHYDFAPRPVQQAAFRIQVRLARELDLPIIIHTREAEDDTIAILRDECPAGVRGVLHCFTGTRRLADAALEMGMHISFAGIVTFPKAANLREIAATVPADRLLCETDSPYLAPTPYRGKRNEPAYIARVAEQLAAVRGEPVESLQGRISANFVALFRP